jgi:AcrR family transcriptional regulator
VPPVQKFSREDIIKTAINLLRKEGIAGITARALGAELGTSSRPIFTAFRNMEEVQSETVLAVKAIYNGYVERGLAEDLAFKGVGKQYIRFAKEEPRLFELLFMKANAPSASGDSGRPSDSSETPFTLENVLPAIDDNSERILASIQKPYGLSREQSYRLYQNTWIFTHGIACLIATGVSTLSEDEVSNRLTEAFTGLLIKMKSEGQKND